MKNKFNILIIFLFLGIYGCGAFGSIKRGLTGEKLNSTDEFLVKKKDPLVFPPRFDDLPVPGEKVQVEEEVKDIEDIIDLKKLEENKSGLSKNKNQDVEKSILKKIKNN